MNGLICNYCVEYFELDVPDWFVTQGAFPRTPLESLDNGVLHGSQQTFINLEHEGGGGGGGGGGGWKNSSSYCLFM